MATPGLVPNIRLVQPQSGGSLDDLGDISVESADEEGPRDQVDDEGNILSMEHDDGSISVSIDGSPVVPADKDTGPDTFFSNIVDKIEPVELSRIANDLIRGIEEDISSRKNWIEERATGIKLLGLNVNIPGANGGADGAPVEGMSTVQHPLLLEAVLRFQANSRSELLPTDGPVKIRNDSNGSSLQQDQSADALEKDLNHYLTATATEYYPDTDRMLFMLGFGGTAFKKVYFCPLRSRPVSESVDADDLIVNNSATDLNNAKRVTHRIFMTPSTVKRMQIIGAYRDIDLSQPMAIQYDAVQREAAEQQGITLDSSNPDDRDREIYECHCELDIRGFEHKHKGRPSGLQIPYRVTIDVSSREILSVVRNYREDTKKLPEKRTTFVKYSFVPGLGFYDIGLLHILGNITNAVTAGLREMLDAGMFASFPGFLFADTGARQNTNIFRVPPGGGAQVKTGGMKIGDAVMPLPYKEPSQALMALIENMAQTGQRVGGTAEMAVGEGRADAPVGTTLAMIEQATKVLNSVHKRMHSAQAQEFKLLAECFRENPESFWRSNRKPAGDWTETTFLSALDDADLVPQADPNTANHTQRMMKVMALKQLQKESPNLYDPIAIDMAALKALGWSNPEQFMAPVEAQSAPPPQQLEREAKAKNDSTRASASMLSAQTAAQSAQVDAHIKLQKAQEDARRADERLAIEKANLQDKAEDRALRERMQIAEVAERLAVHPYSAGLVQPLIKPVLERLTQQQPGLAPSEGEGQ
jgi:hypothetical protein